LLISELEEDISESDRSGYIYVFQGYFWSFLFVIFEWFLTIDINIYSKTKGEEKESVL